MNMLKPFAQAVLALVALFAASPQAHARSLQSAERIRWQPCENKAGAYCASGVAADTVIDYTPDNAEIRFSGAIDKDFDDYVAAAIARFPDARVLVMTSTGGDLHSALQAAKTLNASALAVRASGLCASSCAMLWSAAERREITPRSQMGFHSSRFVRQDLPEAVRNVFAGIVSERMSDVMERAGFPDRVIDKALSTPATRMYWLGPGEIVRAGVACAIVADAGTVQRPRH